MAHLTGRQISYDGMMKTKAAKPDTRTQKQKFIDAAREHGADGDEDTFRKALKKIATAPVPKDKKGAKKPTG